MNFRAVLALPKTASSAQTHKSISFIWIVWSTLYVYLWYYEESLVSSNLNSKQLRFHGAHPNKYTYNFDLILHLTSIWRWVLSGLAALNNMTTVMEFNNHQQKERKNWSWKFLFFLPNSKKVQFKKIIGLQLIIDFNFTTLFS